MRNEPNLRIEEYRDNSDPSWASKRGASWGRFFIPSKNGLLRVISSGYADKDNPWAMGWEHCSVSCKDRCPTWEEMSRVKQLFWGDDETVIEFHPKRDAYVNVHPFCLHLWKKVGQEYELPPAELLK